MAQTQTRRILIKIDTSDASGIKQIADNMGKLNKNTKTLSDNMGFLTNAFRGWLGYLGIRELTRMSDEMQNLYSRLKITTGGIEEADKALISISEIADRTNQSIAGVGTVFNRMALSLKGAKASTAEITTLTESLINTFRVAGATTEETTSTIVQLSQAFSSGELRGQELRSVMEQNATLAQLLRQRFGQDIYKKAADGAIKITDVLRVLADNQKRLNDEAKQLTPTFEQTLTKSMNTLSLAIGELNKQFGLSAKFAKIMEVAVDNLANVIIVAGAVTVAWAYTQIPALIKAITALRAAMLAFTAANPFLLLFTALATGALLLYTNWEKVNKSFESFRSTVLDLSATIEEKFLPLRKRLADFLGMDFTTAAAKTEKSIAGLRKSAEDIRKSMKVDQAGTKDGTDEAAKNMESLIKKVGEMAGAGGKLPKLKEELGAINTAFLNGSIGINQYNKELIDFQLYKLNREFKEGKMDIFKYHEQLRDLNIAQLNREFGAGAISARQFTEAVSAEKMKVLNEQFEAGIISLSEYNKQLVEISDKFQPGGALQAGTQSYLESIGTVSSQVAGVIKSTFTQLEDTLLEFTKTGELNFKKMTQSILDDLTRIIIRASIIQPLAQGIIGGFSGGGGAPASGIGGGGGATTGGAAFAAKGMAFDKKFASGGVVNSPTTFGFGNNKKGLMGEAGPEAIIPLKRTASGDLGVQASVTPVQVNIINQSGAQISQQESVGPGGEKILDVIITQKVKEGISSGAFDKSFSQSFNLKRKGS